MDAHSIVPPPHRLGSNGFMHDLRHSPDYQNLCKAVHCSLGFFILMISTNTVQNISSKAFKDNGYEQLGFYFLGLSYACMGLGSILSPSLMKTLGVNSCMVLGSIFDGIWVIA